MKITEQHKNHSTFLFGKLKGLNNREAARLAILIPEESSVTKLNGMALLAYFGFCKEPNVDAKSFAFVKVKDGIEKPSRSKIVMEYEKHRKLFKAICKARNEVFKKESVDSKVSKITESLLAESAQNRECVLETNFKASVLQHLKDNLNSTDKISGHQQ